MKERILFLVGLVSLVKTQLVIPFPTAKALLYSRNFPLFAEKSPQKQLLPGHVIIS